MPSGTAASVTAFVAFVASPAALSCTAAVSHCAVTAPHALLTVFVFSHTSGSSILEFSLIPVGPLWHSSQDPLLHHLA